jgi:membrane-associated phospholipid phosphatase
LGESSTFTLPRMPQLARWLSVLLHPLFMPVIVLTVLLHVDPRIGWYMGPTFRWTLLGLVVLMSVVFPLTSTLLMVRNGLVSRLDMPMRHERIGPYAVTLLYYGATWYLITEFPLHPAIGSFLLGSCAALLLTLLITLRWKISAHMVGIGGALGTMVALGWYFVPPLFPWVIGTILLCGLLGTARLLSGQHSPVQVYAGAALGFVCLFVAVLAG